MRSTPALTLLASLTSLASSTGAAEANCPTKHSGTLQQIVQSWVDNNQPGVAFGLCAVAMDKHGNKGFACSGKANATRGLDSDTLFQIGSITKTVTAALLARRVVEGTFQLTDRLDPHLPSQFRRFSANPIKVLDLATHHSGLPRDPSVWQGANKDFALLDDCIDTGCLASGTPYEYSNFGFQILGYTLSNADGYGNNWFADVEWNILGLNLMYATKPIEEWKRVDQAYFNAHAASSHGISASNAWTDLGTAAHPHCSTADPSGCLYASPHDMRLWLEYTMGLRTPTQLLGNARDVLRQTYDDGSSSVNDMGLAWRFSYDPDTQCHAIPGPTPGYYTRVAKSGDVDGQHAWMEFLQDPNDPEGVAPLGVVVMANSEIKGTQSLGALGQDLLSKLPLP